MFRHLRTRSGGKMTRPAGAAFAALLLSLCMCAPASAFQPGGPTNYIIDNETVHAARTGNNEKLKPELIKGASPNEAGRDRIPMLLLAAANGHLSTVELLLEYGADPNRRAPDGSTPLTVVALSGRADIAEALLQAGADPDQLVDFGVAARHGVDIHFTDMTGRSALDLAEEGNFREIAALLRAAGG